MSFIRTMLVVQLTALFLAVTTAAAAPGTCYYPDRTTPSQDVPCNLDSPGGSSCCPSNSFCMSNGLCMTDGVLSRASCSDQTWQSPACADVCIQTNPNQNVSLTPCGDNTFSCGLNSTSCTTGENVFMLQGSFSLLLRPSQLASLVAASQPSGSTLPSASSASIPMIVNGQRLYPGSTVIAVGLGFGFPLLMSLVSCFVMLRKIQAKNSAPMYDPPDNSPPRPRPPIPRTISPRPSVSTVGRSPTIRTMRSFNTLNETQQAPAMPRSFLDRYGTRSREEEKSEVYEMDNGKPRYELGSHMSRNEHQLAELNAARLSRDDSQMAELNGSQPDLTWMSGHK